MTSYSYRGADDKTHLEVALATAGRPLSGTAISLTISSGELLPSSW